MKRRVMTLFVLTLFITTFVSLGAYAIDENNKAHKAVRILGVHSDINKFMESDFNFRGSGLYLKGGYVLAAAHMIKNSNEIFDVYDGVGNRRLEFIAKDDVRDLALFKTTDRIDRGYFTLADSIEENELIELIGNTSTREFVKQTGIVTELSKRTEVFMSNKVTSDANRMFTTVPSEHGYSGAPVLNEKGKLVGVVIAKTQEGYAVCVTLADIKLFLVDAIFGH